LSSSVLVSLNAGKSDGSVGALQAVVSGTEPKQTAAATALIVEATTCEIPDLCMIRHSLFG
jgi:hypothetical protein